MGDYEGQSVASLVAKSQLPTPHLPPTTVILGSVYTFFFYKISGFFGQPGLFLNFWSFRG